SITVHPVGNQSQSNQTFSQHHSSINQASSQNQTIKPNKNLDSKASDYFQKGQSAEKQQKYSLAEFYYQKALDSFDQQKYGDAKFRKLIDNHLRQVQAHLSR
ncbi:MAG TPA: hypothetical protein VFC63_01395, partial [Blastocatellia bacterium]|nr:hypothetical protein [Blastocatellia bacterium]